MTLGKNMLRIVLLAFCLGTFALTAKATVPIRVQLEWKYQFEFAGFIVAARSSRLCGAQFEFSRARARLK